MKIIGNIRKLFGKSEISLENKRFFILFAKGKKEDLQEFDKQLEKKTEGTNTVFILTNFDGTKILPVEMECDKREKIKSEKH